jgi:aminoglycoside 2''-phosphotransferase
MTPEEVRARAKAEWPDWRIGRIEPFSEDGWDYQLFLADGAWVVRVGRTAPARVHLRWEARMLDRLPGGGGLPVPRYVRRAHWGGVYRLLPGSAVPADLAGINPAAADAAAARIGTFLGVLHALWPLAPDREARARRRWAARFRRLSRRLDREVWPTIHGSAARRARERVQHLVEGLEANPPPMRLIHADLSLDHLLWNGGQLSGVIDFGDLTLGDPALDFAGLGPLTPGALARYPAAVNLDRVATYRWIAPVHGMLHARHLGTAAAIGAWLAAAGDEGGLEP